MCIPTKNSHEKKKSPKINKSLLNIIKTHLNLSTQHISKTRNSQKRINHSLLLWFLEWFRELCSIFRWIIILLGFLPFVFWIRGISIVTFFFLLTSSTLSAIRLRSSDLSDISLISSWVIITKIIHFDVFFLPAVCLVVLIALRFVLLNTCELLYSNKFICS